MGGRDDGEVASSMHWEYGDSGNEFVRLTVTGPAPGPGLAWRLVQGEFLRKYGVHMAGRSWEDAGGARHYEVGFW